MRVRHFLINCSSNGTTAHMLYYLAVNEWIWKDGQHPRSLWVVKVTRLSGLWRSRESDPAFNNLTDITLAGVQGATVMAHRQARMHPHTHTHTTPFRDPTFAFKHDLWKILSNCTRDPCFPFKQYCVLKINTRRRYGKTSLQLIKRHICLQGF